MSEAAQLDLLSWKLHDGATFEPERDGKRINKQLQEVYAAMQDGQWRTLYRLHTMTGHPEQSLSARLRDLRKTKFGGYTVERRRAHGGTWEYRVLSAQREKAA